MLFINVLPSTLVNVQFIYQIKELMKALNILPKQIVLEISESERITDYDVLKKSITTLKNMDLLIALNDIGKGFSGLQKLVTLEPDFIKIDKFFAKNIQQSPKKQNILHLLINYCRTYKIKTILEGIESIKALKTARQLGVHFGQGYLFGKPNLLKTFE